ncbi:hypothetical protein B0H19DRAFT_1266990 [Mycena capillaripes]|nr:hypothetical protein B0H19DRAFT_1266990 [Mycena capillaripes]
MARIPNARHRLRSEAIAIGAPVPYPSLHIVFALDLPHLWSLPLSTNASPATTPHRLYALYSLPCRIPHASRPPARCAHTHDRRCTGLLAQKRAVAHQTQFACTMHAAAASMPSPALFLLQDAISLARRCTIRQPSNGFALLSTVMLVCWTCKNCIYLLERAAGPQPRPHLYPRITDKWEKNEGYNADGAGYNYSYLTLTLTQRSSPGPRPHPRLPRLSLPNGAALSTMAHATAVVYESTSQRKRTATHAVAVSCPNLAVSARLIRGGLATPSVQSRHDLESVVTMQLRLALVSTLLAVASAHPHIVESLTSGSDTECCLLVLPPSNPLVQPILKAVGIEVASSIKLGFKCSTAPIGGACLAGEPFSCSTHLSALGISICLPGKAPLTKTCNIRVEDKETTTSLGYVSAEPDSRGGYSNIVQPPTSKTGALVVSFTYSADATRRLALSVTNAPNAAYPFFGAILGDLSASDGSFGPGILGYAKLGGTALTPPGATPAQGPNSEMDAIGEKDIETAIWNFDTETSEFSAQWVNSDDSTPPTYILGEGVFVNGITGDIEQYKQNLGSTKEVTKRMCGAPFIFAICSLNLLISSTSSGTGSKDPAVSPELELDTPPLNPGPSPLLVSGIESSVATVASPRDIVRGLGRLFHSHFHWRPRPSPKTRPGSSPSQPETASP